MTYDDNVVEFGEDEVLEEFAADAASADDEDFGLGGQAPIVEPGGWGRAGRGLRAGGGRRGHR